MMAQPFPSTPNEAQLLQINNNLFTENTARSQNEQQLYAAWQKSELEKQQMYNANQNLREELNIMKLDIERLSILKPSETISQEDEISDNDLADDTKWVRVENNKKKRKVADRKSPKQTMQNVTTASTAAAHMQPKQTYKPPPIMITGVTNHVELTSLLNHAIGNENYQTRLLNNGINKINVSSDHAYRHLTPILKDNKISWHSYEIREIEILEL
jgi:hypothetical protein